MEALIAFGVGESLVGRTRYCLWPPHAVGRVAKVGGTKKVNVERILSLEPALVAAVREENQTANLTGRLRYVQLTVKAWGRVEARGPTPDDALPDRAVDQQAAAYQQGAAYQEDERRPAGFGHGDRSAGGLDAGDV